MDITTIDLALSDLRQDGLRVLRGVDHLFLQRNAQATGRLPIPLRGLLRVDIRSLVDEQHPGESRDECMKKLEAFRTEFDVQRGYPGDIATRLRKTLDEP